MKDMKLVAKNVFSLGISSAQVLQHYASLIFIKIKKVASQQSWKNHSGHKHAQAHFGKVKCVILDAPSSHNVGQKVV